MSRIHKLKTLTPSWENVRDGKRLAEVRLNDCDFQVGDEVWLQNFDGKYYVLDKPFGEPMTIKKRITHILFGCPGIEQSYCVLSLGELSA